MYRNLGMGSFDDVTRLSGAGSGSYQYVKWGTELVDFDNDGDRDIFIANGHLQDNVDLYDNTTSYRSPNTLLMHAGHGKFLDVSAEAGDGMRGKHSGRGAAFDDLDGDGDVDVVILNSREPPTILRNDSMTEGHWLKLELRGFRTNRDAVGARVRIAAGDLILIDEVHSGRSYQSHYGSQLHFGLGKRNHIDRIEVHWIGGGTDIFPDMKPDQVIQLFERKSP
jgi:hypothetical protein